MNLNLRKKFLIFLIIVYEIITSSISLASSEPSLISKSYILMDSKTEKILYCKNENERMYPASTTKIITAILVLENCSLEDIVTVSYDTAMSIPNGYSSASLQVGEQLTVEQLLQLLLVHSANDAANALAEHVGGSVDSFVSMMNTKIHELGLVNTHFTNAYGLHEENHYTTAYDLAIIMKYCMKNEIFRRLSSQASCAIPATNKYGPRKYTSTNELIVPNNRNYYSYLTAGKTGFTTQAGDCLVSCSYKDGLELICVVLGGKTIDGISTRFSETKTLYNLGYDNYSIQSVLKQDDVVTKLEVSNGTKETKNLELLASQTLNALVNRTTQVENLLPQIDLKENIQAPIEQGEILGVVSYNIDNISYKVDLIASHPVEESKLLNLILKIGIGILILIFILVLFISKKRKSKNKYRYRNKKI